MIILGAIKICKCNRQKDFLDMGESSRILTVSSRSLSVNKSSILNNSSITYDLKQESTTCDDKKSEKKNLSFTQNASNKFLETWMTNTNNSESNEFLKIIKEKERNASNSVNKDNIIVNSSMNPNTIVSNPPLLQNVIDVRKFSILDVQACENAVLLMKNAEDFSKREECKK